MPARKKSPAPLEEVLQVQVADILRAYCKSDWLWTHFPAGEKRTAITGAKLKRFGLQRGWPDILLVRPLGLIHCLELKRLGEDLNDAQETFQIWCIAHGVPHAVAWTQEQAIAILLSWECLIVKEVNQ